MKTFKQFSFEIQEATRKVKKKVATAAADALAQQLGQIGTGSSTSNLPSVIQQTPTPNLPAVTTPQATTNLPAVRPQTTTNLPATRPQTVTKPKLSPKVGTALSRIGTGVGLALTPSELGVPEEDPEYQKAMKAQREKYPTSSMGPKQRQRYLEKNKPIEGEYIPKEKPGTSVSTKQPKGQTIDAKPKTSTSVERINKLKQERQAREKRAEQLKQKTKTQVQTIPQTKVETKPETKTETKPKTQVQTQPKKVLPKIQPKVKTETQPKPERKKPLPKQEVQVIPPPPKGAAGKPSGGGKAPFGIPPSGGGTPPSGGGTPPSGGGSAAKPFVSPAVDPNIGGGFVTAGVSKGPKGELRTVNVARGKVDEPSLPHKKTGLDIPLQKASNVPYAKPQEWKHTSSQGTTGEKLPPQGSKERDEKLAKLGYKKF
jgi:hypothetical protein